jgi:chemotaxis family two-component system sensor kinase Cph1
MAYDKDDKLRRKAEELLQKKSFKEKYGNKEEDYIHELRVHQIELELQNEELREAQIRLENSRLEYFDLYNLAPVGYFTLDKDGNILKVNLAGAALLGFERFKLINTAFIRYIPIDQLNKFHHHINVLKTGTKENLEIELRKRDDKSFYAYLEMMI